MIVPDYSLWRHVLLDTSILINLFTAQRNGCTDEVALFTSRLIKDLSKRKAKKGQPSVTVTFYISSISLCEILDKLDPDNKIGKIVTALETSNVEFINFDTDVASFLAQTYHSNLVKKALDDSAKSLEFSINNLVNAREYIYKDLMIFASGQRFNCDVILTTDIKTLYPMAEQVDFPCAISYPECFEVTPTYIHRYESDKAEKLYEQKRSPQRQKNYRDN